MLQTINIGANIRLRYIPMTKLKTTTLGVYIHRALRPEEASLNALLPSVLKRGCRLCPTMDANARYLEELYGASLYSSVVKKGDAQIMYFVGETISDRFAPDKTRLLERLFALMLSVLFEPEIKNGGFDAEVVKQEKNNAVNRINALVNDKRAYAQLRCKEEMCAGDVFALSHLGTVEGVRAITPKKLYGHYKKLITSSVIDIYVCGEADIIRLAEMTKKYTDGMSFEKASLIKTAPLVKDAPRGDVTERMDVTQSKLSVGFGTDTAVNSPDMPAMQVFNAVYGGGTLSKLFTNVREKLSLAYYASSQLDRFKGLCVVSAGIEAENYKKALDEILAQLEDIRAGKISDTEFDSAVITIVNSYNSMRDSQIALQLYYLEEDIAGTNEDIDEKLEKIRAVTKPRVVEAAKRVKLDTVYFLTGKETEQCA